MKKDRKKGYRIFDDSDDPEIRELCQIIDKAKAKGLLKDPPKSECEVHTMEQLCMYIFKLVELDGAYQMEIDEKRVKTWVCCGHDFRDKLVDTVERLLRQVPDKDQLEELRLFDTRLSANGVERLRRLFPKARVATYLPNDDADWELAYYHGQADNKWREEMTRKLTAYLDV